MLIMGEGCIKWRGDGRQIMGEWCIIRAGGRQTDNG